MTTRVSTPRTVSINGESYRLNAPVHRQPTSQYPQKIVLGDVDKDSNPRTSLVEWSDWRGGVGLYSTNGKEGLNRHGFSTFETRLKGHLTLPRERTNTSDPSVSGTQDEINELAGLIYAALNDGSDIYSWNPGTDVWSAKLHDIPGAALNIDAVSSTSNTSVNSRTFSHTCTGSNRILIVGVSTEDTGSADKVPTGVTYNTVALTKVVSAQIGDPSVTVSLWYLVAPATGANDIVISLPEVVGTVIGGGISFTGVIQSSLGVAGGVSKTETSSSAPSIDVPNTKPGEVVVDVWGIKDGSVTATVGAGQTQRWNVTAAGNTATGLGSTEPANGSTVTMSWPLSGVSLLAGVALRVVGIASYVTDSLNFVLGGTEYAAFANTNGFSYSSDGSSWTDDATATIHLAYWDDRLWGIDKTGQLWFSTVIGTEVNDAKISLPDNYVNRLFTGPNALGNDILYAATEVGLYAHDAANSRFVRTKVIFPQDSDAGKGAATWNGDIYISPGGMAVYRYSPTQGIVLSVGLDRDAGLTEASGGWIGYIKRLIPTATGVIAVITGTSTQDSIWEYNGVGWHFITFVTDGNAHVSGVHGSYRIYYSNSNRVGYVSLPAGFVNPDIASINYEGTNDIAVHVTPWFNAGQNDVDKTAIRVRIDCTGMSSDETVKVEYAVDYSSSYNASAFTVTADGVTTNTFPTLANNNVEAGTGFRAIRFKLTLNRGSTATNTPNVKSISLEWRRKIPVKWGFSIDIDHRERIEGRSPETQLNDLRTAIESGTLVELVYRSRDDNAENYYVDIITAEIIEETGNEFEGVTRLMASEA